MIEMIEKLEKFSGYNISYGNNGYSLFVMRLRRSWQGDKLTDILSEVMKEINE